MNTPPTTLSTIDKKYIIDRQGKPAVLYAGLLDAAHRAGLKRISVTLLQAPAESNQWTAIVHAHVSFEDGREFEDIGDANPQNVGRMIAAHIVRMAATRAKARALRDALNINGASVEEYGPDDDEPAQVAAQPHAPASPPSGATRQPVRATQEQRTRICAGLLKLGRPIDEGMISQLTYDQADAQLEALISAYKHQAQRVGDRVQVQGYTDADAAAAMPPATRGRG